VRTGPPLPPLPQQQQQQQQQRESNLFVSASPTDIKTTKHRD